MDAELVEINPLVVQNGKLLALDAKIQIDDNAMFRQTGLASLPSRGRSAEEREAFAQGLNYVSLDGNVGIIGNGAGLTMATMDLVESSGGRPANFLDLGGGALSDSFRRGVLFLMGRPRVNAILVNIFGGITRCDEVAKGIAAAAAEARPSKPIVVRLLGTNEQEGRAILESAGITVFINPAEASRKAVALAGGFA
jgi:succinyl-CoA synthetase beta subunit